MMGSLADQIGQRSDVGSQGVSLTQPTQPVLSDTLNGRPVACITGASSGIGAEYARRLARDGWDLLLVARRADRLEALAAELCAAHPVEVEFLTADLSKNSDLARVEAALTGQPRLELLVNNAGFGTIGMFPWLDIEGQERMIRVHVLATVRLTRAALRGMVERRRGSIVNVSSVAAFYPLPGNVTYSATKAYLNAFTEALALELDGTGVRVQALCPGFTVTEFHQTMGANTKKLRGFAWLKADQVVDASLRALRTRQVVVVPGLPYKLLVLIAKYIPRGIINFFVMRMFPSRRRRGSRD